MSEQPRRLHRNLSVWDAIIMSAAFMGPAVSMYYNTGYAASFAGAAMPLTFVISLAACLILANTIGEFSKIAPSAGAFYTFATKGFGPKTGFISGWLMNIGYSLLEPAEEALVGITVSEVLKTYLHILIPWYVISVIAWLFVLVLSSFGAKQSLKISLVLFAGEVMVLLVLCFIILARGGFDGIHFSPFSPARSPSGFSGIALGMVYGVLSFVGFESATTLAEEVRDARKNVYLALMGSTLGVGVLYVIATFAEVNGYGLNNMRALANDPSPFVTLASRYGSPLLVLLLALAGISSIIAVTINVHNAVARVIYAMGREGVLHSSLSKIHPEHGTPTNAIVTQSVLSLVVLLAMGFSVGPSNTYGYLGALLTLGIIPVYILAAIGFVRYQVMLGAVRKHPIQNAVLPVIAAFIMFIPLSASFYPIPPAPYNMLPYIVLAYVIGGFVFILRLAREPERLQRVGQILADADTTPEADTMAIPALAKKPRNRT
ncbi:APC family permease [Alicyclobacillus ferrooxydans]|uniref:Amino acid permease/ SLC12A domain-containing protein n=1 Tax=Alicyclobacillus ferrooxydans TaxID=471514 RepID=A0A0P9D1K6_9BACL|nr:APC family permease [Alicyclobacillus ferrooxydans]KPV43394.1 hypothetical protein AN477_12365 [Alicyclobacillus ferrooxydans]